jgi:hypothetical protein
VARREAEASAEAAALERDLRAAREASENLITARLAASEAELRATESAAAALDARLAKTTREFERYRQVRSISHWSPHDRVRVVNADP